jgi:hypothetical protein
VRVQRAFSAEGSTMRDDLVPDRECGECHMCCDLLTPDRTRRKRPSDKPCANYSRRDGCTIQDHRPPACASWHCAWRDIDWLPEECRPDRFGMMLTVERDPTRLGEQYVLGRAPDAATYKSLLAQDVLWSFMQRMPVRVEIGNRQIEYGAPDQPVNPRFL